MISKILTFSYLIFFFFLSQAQFSSPNILAQCIDCSPYEVHTANIDGRNGLDFIAISQSSVILYSNNGQRQFELKEIYTDPKYRLQKLAATDIDGDGAIDISVFRSKESLFGKCQLVWFKNDGNGNFSALKIGIQDVEIDYESAHVDIDNDGDLDVFGQTYWHINIGEGKFEKKLGDLVSQRGGRLSKIVNMSTYHTRVLMDIDNDQDLDLLLADREIEDKKTLSEMFSPSAGSRWYENDNGQFPFYREISLKVKDQAMIKKGDINGDGYNDLILAYKSKGIFVNLNKRGRSFKSKELIVVSEADLGIPTIVDVDKDGDLDILVEDNDKNAVLTFKNDGRGNFSESEKLFDLEHKDDYFQVKAIDIDQDGFLDIHLYGSSGIYIYFGKEDNKYEKATIITNEGKPRIYGRISLLDYDRDNKTDVLVHNGYRLGWYRNLGEGQFENYEQLFQDTSYNYDSKFYDFDLDGDIDFIKRNFSRRPKHIFWKENKDNGFETVTLFDSIENIYSVNLIESIDSNEPYYIVYAADQIKIFTHSSIGDLHCIANLPPTDNIPNIVDFDKDGKQDILKKISGKLACYYDIFDSGFTNPVTLSGTISNGEHKQIMVHDLNEDGSQDVILVGSNVVWLRGYPDNTFSSGESITYKEDDGYIKKAVIEDIDNDGSPNFIYMTRDGIFYYTKENNYPFGNKHKIESYGKSGNSFELADLDADGDLDLVVTSRDKFSTVWYENLVIP